VGSRSKGNTPWTSRPQKLRLPEPCAPRTRMSSVGRGCNERKSFKRVKSDMLVVLAGSKRVVVARESTHNNNTTRSTLSWPIYGHLVHKHLQGWACRRQAPFRRGRSFRACCLLSAASFDPTTPPPLSRDTSYFHRHLSQNMPSLPPHDQLDETLLPQHILGQGAHIDLNRTFLRIDAFSLYQLFSVASCFARFVA
jgi:hypothetical protein